MITPIVPNNKYVFKSRIFTLILMSFFSVTVTAEPVSDSETKPNVLFLMIDDLRPELGCYGADYIKSPNIDRLSEESLVFDQAYCQVPVCGASRASLMTGVFPTMERFIDARTHIEHDAPEAVTLPQVFREAGYTTLAHGKVTHHVMDTVERSWSETPWNPEIKHSHSLDPESSAVLSDAGRERIYEHPDVSVDAYKDGMTALKTIERLKGFAETGEPFFMACGIIRPHLPFYAPKQFWDLYDRDEIELANNRFRPEGAPEELRGTKEYKNYYLDGIEVGSDEWHRMMRHGYYACVSYADHLVGNILKALDENGLSENTIVILWGDHGWQLGEHEFWGKHNTMADSLQVPFMVRLPEAKKGGRTDAVISTVDIFPTLCELADLNVPNSVQGESFKQIIEFPGLEFRMVNYSRFKNADCVLNRDYSYTSFKEGSEMLFDLRKDPDENRNEAGNPEYRGVKSKMKLFLEEQVLRANNS